MTHNKEYIEEQTSALVASILMPEEFRETARITVKRYLTSLHTHLLQEDIKALEGMKLLEVGLSSERLVQKQMYNKALNKVITQKKEELNQLSS